VRALSRNPDRHRHLADEVAQADLDQPETLKAALQGAHGVFAVTNFWSEGSDEHKQATAAIAAAKDAGVDHFIWSTLPNVEAISGGAFDVRHFTGKARIDPLVAAASFAHHTFVVAPFYYQNLLGAFAPQMQPRGSMGWMLPLDPEVRCLPHLLGRRRVRPDRTREQHRRHSTEPVCDVGPGALSWQPVLKVLRSAQTGDAPAIPWSASA
jgi:hypothetical protein